MQLEEDQGAAHLENGGVELASYPQQIHWSLKFDERTEFGAIVFHHDLVVDDFKERVCSTHANISNLHVCFDAASDFEFAISQVKDVHDFRRSTLDGLEDHVVLIRSIELHDCEHATTHLVFERLLAQLTFQGLPEVAGHSLTFIDQSFAVQPLLKALDVDLAHGSAAFAGTDERVLHFRLRKADAADHLPFGPSIFAVLIQHHLRYVKLTLLVASFLAKLQVLLRWATSATTAVDRRL